MGKMKTKRKFDGKQYSLSDELRTKGQAQKKAKRIRKAGNLNVRVVKSTSLGGTAHCLWIRRKKPW